MGLVWELKQLFIFKTTTTKEVKDIRNAFGKWNYHKASRHTHNANAELEEISPYDSQRCLLRKNQILFDIIISA